MQSSGVSHSVSNHLFSIRSSVLIFSLLALNLLGCQRMLMGMMGFKSAKQLNEKQIAHFATKCSVPVEECYQLDTAFMEYFHALDTARYRSAIKHHYQPLQAMYFDRSGQLKVFYINCNAQGGLNLQWEYAGNLSQFPPKEQTPIDSILPLPELQRLMHPLSTTVTTSLDGFDYVVVVLWSRMMGRQSKELIRVIQKNCSLATDQKVKILYLNNDNFFANAASD